MSVAAAGARPHVGIAVLGGLLLGIATPPAVFRGAEFLVLAGLAAWFALATDRRRPLWHAYVFGCVHMAWFSWSVHHLMWFAYAMIVVVGGVYYALANAAVRAAPQRAQPLVFGVVVAGSFWLRSVMPEIYYPHGQPCHSLWHWPALLRGVVVGGEPLVNGLLAAFAATGVRGWSSWRIGTPAWGKALRNVAIAAACFAAVTALGSMLAVGDSSEPVKPVVVAAIEPGVHVPRELFALPEEQRGARFRELVQERLVAPTRALLGSDRVPDIVLWPESSLADRFKATDLASRAFPILGRWPQSNASLVFGANIEVGAEGEAPPTPAAFLLSASNGRIGSHQEKRVLVPGGEFPPFHGWMPRGVGDTIVAWFEAALGSLPHATPGNELPPLRPEGGVPFGALLCYDNAFPGPANAQVAMGARWLCVLSNEAWYDGGGELVQLMAMTVVRALETGTPIVRCTQDGFSGLVDARGRLVAALPILPSPQPGPRILRVEVVPGPGRLPPLAWLRRSVGPAAGAALLLLLLHGLWRWARLRATRTAVLAADAPGSSGNARRSGS